MRVIRCNKCENDIKSLMKGSGHRFVISTGSATFLLSLSMLNKRSVDERTHICLECVKSELGNGVEVHDRINS